MEHITEEAWKAQLRTLNAREIADPRKALIPVFENAGPRYLEEEFWCWFKSVISNNIWDYLYPAHLVGFSARIEKIVEISWLIDKKRAGVYNYLLEKGKADLTFHPESPTENPWPFVPQHHLRPVEISDPYLVLADFFSYYSLEDIRLELTQWIETALSPHTLIDKREPENLLLFYEMIVRLIKALHLIKTREIDEPNMWR